jgi:hypothetical protein
VKQLDLTGQKFRRLTVKGVARKGKSQVYWSCQCDCGAITEVTTSNLRNDSSKSCGCLAREISRATLTKHGLTKSNVYIVWYNMVRRCHNPTDVALKNPGGRGIEVCERWRRSVSDFAADMGPRPDGYCIERINNDGNYEPGNCKWVSLQERAQNKQNTRCIKAEQSRIPIVCTADNMETKSDTIARLDTIPPAAALNVHNPDAQGVPAQQYSTR